MSFIDEIFENTTLEVEASPEFNVEEWKQGKKAERDQAFSLISQTAVSLGIDEAHLKSYLDVQSRFDSYSVGNALLICAQVPEATRLADFDTWKDAKVHILKGESGIILFEPGKEYTKEDGTSGISYNTKRVFDISQTDAKVVERPVVHYDMRYLVKALITDAPCEFEAAGKSKLSNGRIARYDSKANTIYVLQSADPGLYFENIARELAVAYFEKAGKSPMDPIFSGSCVSYMICRKLGLDVERFTFTNMPEFMTSKDDKAIRDELNIIRDTSISMMGNIFRSFEKQKEAKSKDDAR